MIKLIYLHLKDRKLLWRRVRMRKKQILALVLSVSMAFGMSLGTVSFAKEDITQAGIIEDADSNGKVKENERVENSERTLSPEEQESVTENPEINKRLQKTVGQKRVEQPRL